MTIDISRQEYNEMIETFKNKMSKEQQEDFLTDVLYMEYPRELIEKFVRILLRGMI